MRWHVLARAGVALHLGMALPAVSAGQPAPATLADSARRLDSLATATDVWTRATRASRGQAAALWAQAAALFRRAGDARGESTTLVRAGRAHVAPDTAAAHLRHALRVAQAARDRRGERDASLWLGLADVRAGRDTAALEHVRRAHRLARVESDPDPSVAGWIQLGLGQAHLQLGQSDTADAHFHRALRLARPPEGLALAVAALSGLADVRRTSGQLDSAFGLQRRALQMAREAQYRASDPLLFGRMAELHREQRRVDSVRAYFRLALDAARGAGDVIGEGEALRGIAGGLFQPDSILAYARPAVVIARALGAEWPTRGWSFFWMASGYARLGRPDSAAAYAREALDNARRPAEGRLRALAFGLLGELLVEAHPDSAIGYFRRQAAETSGDVRTRALSQIAWTYARTGRRDSSDAYRARAAESARAADGPGGEAGVWLDLAIRFQEQQYDSSITYARRAIAAARGLGESWRDLRTARYILAQSYTQAGALDSGEAYYHAIIRAARAESPPRDDPMAVNDVGNIHALRGANDSAFAYLHRALAGTKGRRDLTAATFLHNIGVLHFDLGHLDSALVYNREELRIGRQFGNRERMRTAYEAIASAWLERRQLDSALANIRLASEIAGGGAGGIRHAYTVGLLGEIQHRAGQRDSGMINLRRAVAHLRSLGMPSLFANRASALGRAYAEVGHRDSALAVFAEGLGAARASNTRLAEAELLQRLGDVHAASGTAADVARAVAYYDSSAAGRAVITAGAGNDMLRVSFAEAGVELVDRWALAWLARAPELGRERSEMAAFAVAERGRAQALLELLRRGAETDSTGASGARASAVSRAGTDPVEEGRALVAAIRAAGAPVLTYLATRDTLLTWLVPASGDVVMHRQALSRDSAARLIAGYRTAIGVDQAGGGARAILDSSELAASVHVPTSRAAGAPSRATPSRAEATGQALSDVLLPPAIARRLPASGPLVVIPQGQLALTPFVALRVRTPSASDAEPIGARNAIRYAPSVATLRLGSAGGRPAGRPPAPDGRGSGPSRALVVGNPVMPSVRLPSGRTVRLPGLPGAAREGEWVARALGVRPLVGRAATEHAVLALLREASVVHLATHGFAYSSDERALDSFVALAADSAAGGTGNGLLTVGEILDGGPRMVADLVVLSACQTGLGNLKQAEGTVGLQRAFLARGARSVLVSLWSVSDEATELLMRRFYTHWLRDADRPGKAEALRRAQADVRAVPRFREPRYWAAFQLVGAR